MISNEDKEILLDHEKIAEEKRKYEEAYAERQKFLDDIRNDVIDRPGNRRFIWDLLGLLGYQKKLFSSDPLVMAANCGTHDNVLLILLHDLEEAKPGILFKMQNEFRSAQASKKE